LFPSNAFCNEVENVRTIVEIQGQSESFHLHWIAMWRTLDFVLGGSLLSIGAIIFVGCRHVLAGGNYRGLWLIKMGFRIRILIPHPTASQSDGIFCQPHGCIIMGKSTIKFPQSHTLLILDHFILEKVPRAWDIFVSFGNCIRKSFE